MIRVLLERVQRTMVNLAARCESEDKAKSGMCTNLDTGGLACPVPFLVHESINKASECIVIMGQHKIMSWVSQACF
jgi:hypothetical protein